MGRRDRVVLGLLVHPDLRCADTATLRWADLVRTPAGWIANVTGKEAKPRAVPVTNDLMALLDDWAAWPGHNAYWPDFRVRSRNVDLLTHSA